MLFVRVQKMYMKFLINSEYENGNVVSTRTSARNYVACTADGSFYFGRLDLIGKGDHGKRLSHTAAILANPEKEYKKWLRILRRITGNNGKQKIPPNNGLPAILRAQQRKRRG